MPILGPLLSNRLGVLMKSAFCLSLLFLLAPIAGLAQLSFNQSTYSLSDHGLGNTTGDFNHDGLPDVAVGEGNSVAVFLATGPGTYGTRADYDTGASANFISAADIDGDGALDLIIGHLDARFLTVLLNNGDGTFRSGTNLLLGGNSNGFALADFNGDGFVDVVATACASASSGCTVNVFLNNGDATFGTNIRLASSDNRVSAPVAIDFNRDGFVDVAVAASTPTRGLVYFGDGTGNFPGITSLGISNPIPLQAVEAPTSLTAGDFDGDTTPDLAILSGYVCGSACGHSNAHIFISNADQTFTEVSTVPVWTTGGGGQLIASDFNGDMVQDLLFWNGVHFGGGNSFWLGNGDGSFSPATSNLNGADISQFTASDLDLDSRHDLVMTTSTNSLVLVALNSGGTTNCPASGGDPTGPVAIVCGPQDGDVVAADTPFTVQAGGRSPAGIMRMELWVDGDKQFEIWNDQLNHDLVLSPGTHQVAVVAVDRYTGFGTTSLTITAQ